MSTHLKELGGLLAAGVGGAVCVERLLSQHCCQIEEHRGLLEVDAALLGFLGVAEGIIPDEAERNVACVPADGEARLHQAQSTIVPAHAITKASIVTRLYETKALFCYDLF